MNPFAAASNAFGFDLWSHLRASGGNQVFSPASLSVALDMALAGARGETAAQLARVLHAPEESDGLHSAAGAALASWNDPARQTYTLAVANRLFGERSLSFEAPFLALTREVYRAPLERVDFAENPEAARAAINRWVETQTRDRIRDLVPEGRLTTDTRLVLVNAVSFLATWETPFEPDLTDNATFYAGGSREVKVPTMHRTDWMRLGETPDVQVVELPYLGNEIAMTIVLPRQRTGLQDVEAQLDADRFHGWVEGLQTADIELAMPTFAVAPERSIGLTDVLGRMGMVVPFDRDRADFTGIAKPPNPQDRLAIDSVFHRAFVKVDEAGTEAAAASDDDMDFLGFGEDLSIEVRVDHPFLFFIRDVRAGTVLFMGRVEDPS